MGSQNDSTHAPGAPEAASARPTNAGPIVSDARWGHPRRAASADEDSETLAAARLQLDAALREIDALRKRETLLRDHVAALAQAVAKARRFAHRDELTGLPNRRLLLDRFHQAVAQCERQHKEAALLFLDLDGFKRINDALGHAAGDALLKQVAARLAGCIRKSDTACRYGGDEFVVLLPEIEGPNAAAVADKIRAQLAMPYVVADIEINVNTSLGMAVYPVDGKAYDDLMEASDRKMYRSKSMAIPPRVRIDKPLLGSPL